MDTYSAVVRDAATGAAAPGASVSILNADGVTLATIYLADGITEQQNPLATDNLGRFTIAAANGKYFAQVNVSGVPAQPFRLYDPSIDPALIYGHRRHTETINFNPALGGGFGPYPLDFVPVASSVNVNTGSLFDDASYWSTNANSITFSGGADVTTYASFTISYDYSVGP